MISKNWTIFISLTFFLSVPIVKASDDSDLRRRSTSIIELKADGDDSDQRSVVRYTHLAPQQAFKRLGENIRSGENSSALITDQIKTLWKFRYLPGVDQRTLRELARANKLSLEDGPSSKIEALRLFIGHHRNYGFFGRSLPLLFATTSTCFSFIMAYKILVSIPMHVPAGTQFVYAVLDKAICGGELDRACFTDLLSRSLGAEIQRTRMAHAMGIVMYSTVNIVSPFIFMTVFGTRGCKLAKVSPAIKDGYKTVDEGIRYLDHQDREYSEHDVLMIYGGCLLVSNVIGTLSLISEYTGTVVDNLVPIAHDQFRARFFSTACAMKLGYFVTVPCNSTTKAVLLDNLDLYRGSTKVIQATVINLLPYVVPGLITLLQWLVLILKLI